MSIRYYDSVQVGDSLEELRISVSTTDVICGALASRDYSPLHHDFHYATEQAGHRDIFLNTPHQADTGSQIKTGGTYEYSTLEGRMLTVELKVRYKDALVDCGMKFVEELDYPLMFVKSVVK